MPLFQVAFIQNPTKKAHEEGEQEKLLYGPVNVIAQNEQQAAVSAALDPEDGPKIKDAPRDRLEVAVRPF